MSEPDRDLGTGKFQPNVATYSVLYPVLTSHAFRKSLRSIRSSIIQKSEREKSHHYGVLADKEKK